MYTQNTPIHMNLWHRGFWMLVLSNMLLSMSVYMLIPILPMWMMGDLHQSPLATGVAMGIYGVGVFLLGGFCSYLIQRFRRNRVCIWSVAAMMACTAVLWLLRNTDFVACEMWMVWAVRLLVGATFGLADMVLASTLVIDQCESFQRTEANYVASWFRRFALSLGPMLSLVVYRASDFDSVLLLSMATAFLSIVLIRMVNFPFKAPEDTMKLVSLDRFFLPQAWPMFLNLLMVSVLFGMIMSVEWTERFYAMMMAGFLLALVAQKFVFVNAELKSEAICGMLSLAAALILMITQGTAAVDYLSPVLVGFGVGMIGSRFLLFFIKLSDHCQRGTSQSTFFLCWELGMALGLFVGYAVLWKQPRVLLLSGLALVTVALAFYHFVIHQWYLKHKNR